MLGFPIWLGLASGVEHMSVAFRNKSQGFLSIGIFIAALSGALFGATEFVIGEVRLAGFPSMVLGGQTAEAELHQFETPFDNRIDAGALQISLEKTPMSDVQKYIGGEIQSHTALGKSTRWLCYELSVDGLKRRIWFVADGQPKNGNNNLVNFISTEQIEDHIQGCEAPRVNLAKLSLPVPTLKDSPDTLLKRFGASVKQGLVRYSNEQTNKAGEVVVQSLVYRIQDGAIDAIAFSQATAHQ